MAGIATALDIQVFDKPRNEGRVARKTGSRKIYLDFSIMVCGSRRVPDSMIRRETGIVPRPCWSVYWR